MTLSDLGARKVPLVFWTDRPQTHPRQKTAMKYILLAIVAVFLFVQALADIPYPPPLDRNPVAPDDYNENVDMYMKADKRACIRRGGSCDGKPNDCCPNSACRCNLWGTNCRCERAGLFQQWGK